MITEIIKIDTNNIDYKWIQKAAYILKQGGLVAFPTETVYGIGANALSETAIKKIYTAKGRPSDNPLIVHIGHVDDVNEYAQNISEVAKKLMNKFWPGPLTLIFKKKPIINETITGGLDTVAIRLPANEIARAIIKEAKLPIAAPSANRSGKPSPTRAKHVIEDLGGRVDMIVDGGKAQIGLESTVLDVSGSVPVILRPGSITKKMLEEVVGEVLIDPALLTGQENIKPKSPGMKYRHYAPKGHLTVIYGEEEKAISYINENVQTLMNTGRKVAIISTVEEASLYHGSNIMIIGSMHDHKEIASNLFKLLRLADEQQIEYIFTRAFSEEDIGMATMNRLLKAAGNKKICL